MAWRVAKSLLVLRDQIDAAHPGRSTASDGTIGDPAHQSQGSASDHNPWLHLYGDPTGIVTALDVTHDPAHGCDIDALTDELAASRDPRIKFMIANSLILSGADGPSPWTWRPYGGSDPHANHCHLSVVADPRCDDTRLWAIAGTTGGDDIMSAQAESILASLAFGVDHWTDDKGKTQPLVPVKDILARSAWQQKVDQKLDALAAAPKGSVTLTDADRDDIAARVLAKLGPALADELAKRLES